MVTKPWPKISSAALVVIESIVLGLVHGADVDDDVARPEGLGIPGADDLSLAKLLGLFEEVASESLVAVERPVVGPDLRWRHPLGAHAIRARESGSSAGERVLGEGGSENLGEVRSEAEACGCGEHARDCAGRSGATGGGGESDRSDNDRRFDDLSIRVGIRVR